MGAVWGLCLNGWMLVDIYGEMSAGSWIYESKLKREVGTGLTESGQHRGSWVTERQGVGQEGGSGPARLGARLRWAGPPLCPGE